MENFNILSEDLRMILPISIYIASLAIGPSIFGPLRESVGRKAVLITTFAAYFIITMASALAPDFPALVVFRFLCGLGGTTPNGVLGDLFSDFYTDPHHRGLVMSWFMFAPIFPSLLGPIISGFVSTVPWRWAFWSGLIIGEAGFPLILAIPETFYPVLLRRAEDALSGKRRHSLPAGGFRTQMRRFFKRSVRCSVAHSS